MEERKRDQRRRIREIVLLCDCGGGGVGGGETEKARASDLCCMSVDCVETYCCGIGKLKNPLQWPQLRKKRRCFRVMFVVIPPRPVPLPFLEKLRLLLPPISSKIGISPRMIVPMIAVHPRMLPSPR